MTSPAVQTLTDLGVLIVDDEPLARARLARQLSSVDHVELLGVAEDAESALLAVERLDPDLVLLDIEMPGDNGLELAQQLSALEYPPAIIFCTAHDEFALPAFATAAVGYLLKPVTLEQLSAAIHKAQRLTRAQHRLLAEAGAQTESARVTSGVNTARIRAVSRRGVELLEPARIRCFVADSKYVVAHHDGGETILDQTLKELETLYPTQFLRVHRNALVSVEHVSGLRRDGNHYRVQLEGTEEEPLVSRRMLAGVKSALLEFS